jgi:hypothetical protein
MFASEEFFRKSLVEYQEMPIFGRPHAGKQRQTSCPGHWCIGGVTTPLNTFKNDDAALCLMHEEE